MRRCLSILFLATLGLALPLAALAFTSPTTRTPIGVGVGIGVGVESDRDCDRDPDQLTTCTPPASLATSAFSDSTVRADCGGGETAAFRCGTGDLRINRMVGRVCGRCGFGWRQEDDGKAGRGRRDGRRCSGQEEPEGGED